MAKLKFSRSDDPTSRLPFKPLEKYNNLCLGYGVAVSLTRKDSKDEAKWEFAGHNVPRINFEFIQHREKEGDKDRFYTFGENPPTIIKTDGDRMDDSTIEMRYEKLWNKIKHIYDSYQYAPNWKPFPFDPEFDADADVEARLKEWDKFFTKIVDAFMKGKDKENPIFPEVHDKTSVMVMKLAARENRLQFPEFANTGFIEKAKVKSGALVTDLEFRHNETVNIASTVQDAAMPAVAAGQFRGGDKTNLPGKLSSALED